MRAPLPQVVEAAQLALEREVDVLVGLGGSTISDAARVIAVMVAEGVASVEGLRALGRRFAEEPRPDLSQVLLARQVHIQPRFRQESSALGRLGCWTRQPGRN